MLERGVGGGEATLQQRQAAARGPRLRESEREAQGHQALLGAVVQITLEAPASCSGSLDDAAPRVA